MVSDSLSKKSDRISEPDFGQGVGKHESLILNQPPNQKAKTSVFKLGKTPEELEFTRKLLNAQWEIRQRREAGFMDSTSNP